MRFLLDESDIECFFQDQDSDGEMGTRETTDMNADVKFIVYIREVPSNLFRHTTYSVWHASITLIIYGKFQVQLLSKCLRYVSNKYVEPNSQ